MLQSKGKIGATYLAIADDSAYFFLARCRWLLVSISHVLGDTPVCLPLPGDSPLMKNRNTSPGRKVECNGMFSDGINIAAD